MRAVTFWRDTNDPNRLATCTQSFHIENGIVLDHETPPPTSVASSGFGREYAD